MRSTRTPFSARWAAATALPLLAACADQPTTPGVRAPIGSALAFTTSPSGARLISNTVKYSDAGQKPTSARAGSAALAARALIGSDMVTELEVRATPADPTRTVQAQLQKLKVKAIGYNADTLFEANHNALTGPSYTRSYTGLGWGMTLQLQANVTGVDPNRTDVVNAAVPVLLRPDISPWVWLTQRARVGEPYTVSAWVSEGNGQVGARADCVLYVDGTAVDRALGIWVDAYGQVTCAFTHTFTSEGRKQVEVRVENVSPGDWNTGNNTSGGEVLVVAADNYFEEARATHSTTYTRSMWSYDRIDRRYNFGDSSHDEYTDDRWSQNALAYGGFNKGLSGPLTIHASQTTGGRTVHDLTIQVDSLQGYSCFSRFDGSAAVTFYACTSNSPYFQSTTFRYDRNAGAVTYHSSGYGRSWDGNTGDEFTYHYNNDFSNTQGVRVEYGQDYTFSLQFVTPHTTYTTSITLPLTYSEHTAGGPGVQCSVYDEPNYYYVKSCHSYEYRSTSLSGEWPRFF